MNRSFALIAVVAVLFLGAASCTDDDKEPSAAPETTEKVEDNPSVAGEPEGPLPTVPAIPVPDSSDMSTAPLEPAAFCELVNSTANTLFAGDPNVGNFAAVDEKVAATRAGAPLEISEEINLWSTAFASFMDDVEKGVPAGDAGKDLLAENVVAANDTLSAWMTTNCVPADGATDPAPGS